MFGRCLYQLINIPHCYMGQRNVLSGRANCAMLAFMLVGNSDRTVLSDTMEDEVGIIFSQEDKVL